MRTFVIVAALTSLAACGATNPNQPNYDRAKANSEYVKTHGDGHGGGHGDGHGDDHAAEKKDGHEGDAKKSEGDH